MLYEEKFIHIFFLFTQILVSQGLTLSDAQPFCSDNSVDFNNTFGNVGVLETLPNFGCLNEGLLKNPVWYFLKIRNPGSLTLELTSKDVDNNDIDADFVAWGPFNRTEFQNAIDDGTGKDLINVISCSSIPGPREVIKIQDANAGEYYIVLITNYSGVEGSMSLEEKFPDEPNTGTTDCSVLDTTPPEITLVGSATVTIEAGTTYSDAGASALDNYDGDITSAIVTTNPVDTSVLGSYTITYNVVDTNGNSAEEVTRTVLVIDSTLPIITLLGDVTTSIETGGIYTDAGASALDNYDGDITSAIVTTNPVDTSIVGSYTITYNVSDTNGNNAEEVTRTVLVVKSFIVEIPSFFTPNGDGVNDNWQIKIINSNYIIKKLVIFDRFGKTIIANKVTKWDGTYNGNKMPEGSYWYKLILEGRNEQIVIEKGYFSLTKG